MYEIRCNLFLFVLKWREVNTKYVIHACFHFQRERGVAFVIISSYLFSDSLGWFLDGDLQTDFLEFSFGC